MERDLAGSRKVREYLVLSDRYLEAAETLVGSKNWEPAMANVLHSIELSIKAALSTVVKGEMRTHQVAGLFGEHFRAKVGKGLCRDIARALMRYNLPRYPGEEEIVPEDVKDALKLARRLRDETVPALLKGRK